MSKVVVAANRGPATLYLDEAGVVRARHAAGGLAPSLVTALSGSDATWVAAATTDLERAAAKDGLPPLDQVAEVSLRLVDVEPAVVDGALRVVANATLWFCLHGLFDRAWRPIFNRHFHDAYESYRSYNRAIAEAIDECADEGATVFVNDYHLFLVGSELAARRADLKTVHFLHTPFCSPDELAVLPAKVRDELIDGLCAYGACGFHTERWAAQFEACAASRGRSASRVFVAPLGIDEDKLVTRGHSTQVERRRDDLLERHGDRKIVFRSDRLELSKNVVRGFLAFEELLETAPRWIGKVVFVAHLYPSREDLAEYLAYRATVEQVVERINERFGGARYEPIELYVEDDYEASLAAATAYDVLLVNPLRDGMNLVAKEGAVLNRKDGVIVLSSEAGAALQLADAAIVIDPFDVSATADALDRALSMDQSLRAETSRALRRAASVGNPTQWFDDVLSHAERSHAKS